MKSAIAILITALMLAVAPAAFGQDASVNGYGGAGGTQQKAAQGGAAGDPDAGTASEAGTLPFTGLDVGIAAAGGLLLIAVGASVAWLARPRDAS